MPTNNDQPEQAATTSGGADWGPESAVWLPGVDYVTTWRDAKNAADALNALFRAYGFPAHAARATAVSMGNGDATVRLRLVPEAARLVNEVMARFAARNSDRQ